MRNLRLVSRPILAVVAFCVLASPVTGTTLLRRGLDQLTAENESIVQAKVLDIRSYWNDEHTFILTDVHARPSHTLKGESADDLHFTVMGGTVGALTTLIVGGPDLAPGSEYVLFLSRTDLPGAPGRLSVRDLAQGVFDVRRDRAFSQAIGEMLLPDARGLTDVAGGEDGIPLETLARLVSGSR